MPTQALELDELRITAEMHVAAWEILGDDLESLIEYQDETAEEYQDLCRKLQEASNV